MNENTFMRVDEVANELGVSKSYAYKIVQQLNAELKSLGYLTISGRIISKACMALNRMNGYSPLRRTTFTGKWIGDRPKPGLSVSESTIFGIATFPC